MWGDSIRLPRSVSPTIPIASKYREVKSTKANIYICARHTLYIEQGASEQVGHSGE